MSAGDGSAWLHRTRCWNDILLLSHLPVQQDVLPTSSRAVLATSEATGHAHAPYSSLLRLRCGSLYSLKNILLLICNCHHEFKHLEIICICCSKSNYGDTNQLVQKVQSVIKLKLFIWLTGSGTIESALF